MPTVWPVAELEVYLPIESRCNVIIGRVVVACLPTDGVPIPDKAVIEMVSFHDRKRYRIKVDLPANLEQQMRQVYSVEGRYDRRSWLYFGLAPGGY